MARPSLLEYFQRNSRPANEPAVVWRSGYRVQRWNYGDLFRAASGFCGWLRSSGVSRGDRVLLWGENSGEWLAAFWGCMLCGVVAVPMDAIADRGFVLRVAQQAGVRAAIVSRGLPSIGIPVRMVLEELSELVHALDRVNAPESVGRDEPIEIVFTSGTTAEPRGVVITHGNVLANIEPIEREIEKYRRYERFFHPLRFLDLLPLSHVFGQLLGIFIPQILGATSVFSESLNPSEIVRTIHDERVSVLVTVPRLVASLKDYLERDLASEGRLDAFRRNFAAAEGQHFLRRWWRFRWIHRRFGWKFWAIISGGAALAAEAEQFWGRLGYAVIQGYGLTETTSLVSVNHPFRLGRGSIGKALPGREVKLAADGEILVRGESVAQGYWKGPGLAPVHGEDGWFHTGDIGERDAAGNLYFKGRSKNVIVTPEGLNVFPQDLEAELRKENGVRDCAVVGVERDGNAEPCAVLLLRDFADAAAIVQHANARLAPFQQMRHWMIWPESDFPRTATQKPLLGALQTAAEQRFGTESAAASRERVRPGPLREMIARFSGAGPDVADHERLHLSSIERVELLSALEDRYQLDLSETQFANADTVEEIDRLIENPETQARTYHYPRWAQSWPVRIFRAGVFNLLARPAMLLLGWPSVHGRDNLRETKSPVLVVANHITFFDPAYIMEGLPERFRAKLAVAMDGELLESMRNPPPERGLIAGLADRAAYWLIVSIYNVFPLPLHAGFRKSFAFVGDLIDRGWNVLIFAEGMRTKNGDMGPFRAGIGMLATQLQVPVVPMRMEGIFELGAAGKHWAPPGRIMVWIGPAAKYDRGAKPEQVAQDLHQRVAALGAPRA